MRKDQHLHIRLDSVGRRMVDRIAVHSGMKRNQVINVILRIYGERYLQNVKRVFEDVK